MDEEVVLLESDRRLSADGAIADDDKTDSAPAENLNHESINCRHNKLKLLVRSHAIREAASPPPDPSSKLADAAEGIVDDHTETDGFNDTASSTETYSAVPAETYTDNTGIDLHQFIVETLHRNQKDRTTLLRIEQEMVGLVRDAKRTCHRFPPMSSYHRMLVHRVAAFFGLEHNVDQSGNSVVVSKSSRTRLPEIAFKQYVRDDVVLPEEPARKFNLKREVFSLDGESATNRGGDYHPRPAGLRSSQSFDHGNSDAVRTQAPKCYPPPPTTQWGAAASAAAAESTVLVPSIQYDKSAYTCRCSFATCGEQYATCRNENQGILRVQRIQKVESLDGTELRLTHQRTYRPAVAKSYSFGGYGTTPYAIPDLGENPAEGAQNVAPQRLQHGVKQQGSFTCRLSKQDSNSSSVSISRSSPTSSGYKSQQSQSVSAAPSPTPLAQNRLQSRQPSSWNNSIESQNSGPELLVPSELTHPPEGVSSLLWAVTSLDAVPPGSILINPQTGQPFYNPDGTVYRYDPQYSLPPHVEAVICSQQSEDLRNSRAADFAGSRDESDRGEFNHYINLYNPDNVPQMPIANYEPRPFSNHQSAQAAALPYQPASNFYDPNFQNMMEERRGIECIAIPQGNGYFLYQTSGTVDSGANHLNCMMKNLQIRGDCEARARNETPASMPSRPGFALQTSLPAGGFPIPAGPGTLLPSGATPMNPNACLQNVHMHPGNVAPYPVGNAYQAASYPPVVYTVPPGAVHSHHACSQYVLNSYAQHQYTNSQFLSSAFPVAVTPNPPEGFERDKGNAQCLPVSYLPLGYRPNDTAMLARSSKHVSVMTSMTFINQLTEGGEVHHEPRTAHHGIQRQFSLQSPPCALNSGNQSLNQVRQRPPNRTIGIGTESLSRAPKKHGRVQQHLNQQPSNESKSPN